MATKTYNHNGKELKKVKGKNIRVSTDGWQTIREYCIRNGYVMGVFVENAALDKILSKLKKSK